MVDTSSGILQLTKSGAGYLFDPDQWADTVYVPAKLIKGYRLPQGSNHRRPGAQRQEGTTSGRDRDGM